MTNSPLSNIENNNTLEVLTVTDIAEVESLRAIWEQLQNQESRPTINADIDRFLSVLRSNKVILKPYIILIKQNNQPAAMVLGRIEHNSIEIKLGYKVILSPKLRCLTIVYGGILGKPTNDISSLIIRHLLKALRNQEADVIYFNHIGTDSSVLKLGTKTPGILSRGYFPRVEKHWRMSVPDNLEQFYLKLSKKHKGNLKRYIKTLDKKYPGQISIITYTKEDEVDTAIKLASQVSQTTYQYGLGCGLEYNSDTRLLLTTAARKGWLRMSVIFVKREPVAFQVGLKYNRQYMLEQIGFNPKWSRCEPGAVLFIKILEQICADKDIEYINFGFGDADYKRSYGDEQWQEASFCIFASRTYPIFVNILQSSIAGLSLVLEYILNRTGVVGWIKRSWRKILRAKEPKST